MQSHRIRRVFDPNEVNTQLVATVGGTHAAYAAARAHDERSLRLPEDDRDFRELRSLMGRNRAAFL